MMKNIIYYETKEPVIFNKGTEWELSCYSFLYKYVYEDAPRTQSLVEELNQMLADGVEVYDGLVMANIKRFYPGEQEEMY